MIVGLDAAGSSPAGSRPTWVVALPTGTHVIVAARRDGTGILAVGQFETVEPGLPALPKRVAAA